MRPRGVLVAGFLALASSLTVSAATVTPPSIVERGRSPNVRACADCHLMNGLGRPDSSSLAGLPAEYIAHQIGDFRRGVRTSGDARIDAMTAVANALDDREIADASAYFASIRPQRWLRVVERDRPSGVEPIHEVLDGRRGYVAFVPRGSLQRGEFLVEGGGGGRTVRCANCHGADLKGTSQIPGIAGRSPTYLTRQLNDMRRGLRRGLGTDRMMATIARVSDDDVVAMAAYAASLAP